MKCVALICFCAVLLSIAGCRSAPVTKEKSPFQSLEDDSARIMALESGGKMLKALQANDYASFVAPMEESARKRFTKEVFEQFRKRISEEKGEIVASEFVTDLKQEVLAAYVWKVTSRKPRTDRTGKEQTATINIDWLFRLVVAKLDGKYVVFGFGL